MCALQIEIGPSKSLISPKAMQFSVTASGQLADLNHMRIDYEATTCGIGERGNVLVGGGMKAAHDPCKIDNRSNVRAVIATTSQSCVAELPDQVRGSARSESCHHRLAMSVVQHQLIGMLR